MQSILFGVVAGVFAANATPHFVKGITKEPFPTLFGPSPVVNLVAGWGMYLIAGTALWFANPVAHPLPTAAAAAGGVLAMGVFHATIGPFGLMPNAAANPSTPATIGHSPTHGR